MRCESDSVTKWDNKWGVDTVVMRKYSPGGSTQKLLGLCRTESLSAGGGPHLEVSRGRWAFKKGRCQNPRHEAKVWGGVRVLRRFPARVVVLCRQQGRGWGAGEGGMSLVNRN